ncbi:ATP-binding protein [Lysinimonas soli]|uniref:histidine kinase n=1 Tax=Lysinimonas soli TaxID=1074233 RepID=A0ABW0NNN0_9MICO
MRRLSIRARITLGSVLVAAALLAIALGVVRVQVGDILSNADVALARGDLASFQRDITANPTAEVDDPGTGVLVYVRDPSGAVDVNTLPHDVLALVEHRPAADEQFTTTDDEHRGFVVVARTVKTSAGEWALWSARSTSSSELAIAGLDRVLVIGGIVLLLCFAIASWLLASFALRPVSRMRRQAETLGAGIDGDLPVGPADDEIAALAVTLNELLARVRASTAREKQMVSDAAHELRTPLAALTTQLELAHDDTGDAEALAAHLRGAEASVERLSSLATNLLELNRLEAEDGRVGHARTSELVTELMGGVDRARMLALSRSTEIGFELDVGGEEQDYALDPQAFGRIADNLLANAITAVGTGGSVEAGLVQDSAGITLSIVDNGPGMPESFRATAFERFSRPDHGRTTAAGGSGLGLALVHALVTAAGGTVELHNRQPGFEVAVRIPKM